MPAQPGGPGGWKVFEKFWLLSYVVKQRDRTYLATPFGLPRLSPVLDDLTIQLGHLLGINPEEQPNSPLEYNAYMDALKFVWNKWGLVNAVLPHAAFCPVPANVSAAALKKGRLREFSVEYVLANSLGVNCFWQSMKTAGSTAIERGARGRFEPGSFWDLLRRRILPEFEKKGPKRMRTYGKQTPQSAIPWPMPLFTMPALPSLAYAEFSTCRAYKDYELFSQIGKGSFGDVFLGKHKGTGEEVVAKIVNAGRVHGGDSVQHEVYNLYTCQSDNVIRLLDAYADPFFAVLIMERMRGDVAKMLLERPGGVVSKAVAVRLLASVSRALAYIHGVGVMHRDLTDKNVLVDHTSRPNAEMKPGDLAVIKLADFGKATTLLSASDQALTVRLTACCAAGHAEPPECLFRQGTRWQKGAEIDSQPSRCTYTETVDIWAVGVLFLLLLKARPITGSTPSERARAMIRVFGAVPRALAHRLRWSVHDSYVSDRRDMQHLHHKGEDQWTRFMIPVAFSMCRYDPEARSRAVPLVAAFEEMSTAR